MSCYWTRTRRLQTRCIESEICTIWICHPNELPVCLWTLSEKKLLQLLDLNHSCLKHYDLERERKVMFVTQAIEMQVRSDFCLAKVHRTFLERAFGVPDKCQATSWNSLPILSTAEPQPPLRWGEWMRNRRPCLGMEFKTRGRNRGNLLCWKFTFFNYLLKSQEI